MSSQATAISGTTGTAENAMKWDHPPERPNFDCPLVSNIDISTDDRGLSKMEKTVHFSKFFASRDLIYIKRLKAVVLKLHNEIQATTAKISFATDGRGALAKLANDMGRGVEKLANPVRPNYPMQHAFEILVRDVHEGKIALHESEKKNKALKQELDYEKQSHAEEVTTLVEERDEALRRASIPATDTYNHEGVLVDLLS
ncbi:hypothetical protein COL154_013822 [Colletotrichum chrysophilum]|nr:hypothetical protein COL154_013822 [Colletotrichum chrysophilum]